LDRGLVEMNYSHNDTSIEIKTIGDSRGYLWKIIIDKKRGIGKIVKISGLDDINLINRAPVDGSEHTLENDAVVSEDMQALTNIIESRFHAA